MLRRDQGRRPCPVEPGHIPCEWVLLGWERGDVGRGGLLTSMIDILVDRAGQRVSEQHAVTCEPHSGNNILFYVPAR